MERSSRSLICINTCNRLVNAKSFAWDYMQFCRDNDAYDFVLALDGNNPEYIDYARRYGVPLIWSDEREGVCLSKNRVLKHFPDYDYYFFLDDDAQLVDPNVFDLHIRLSRETGIHHLILGKRGRQREIQGITSAAGYQIEHALFGTGQFTFYTGEGLAKVGGFHTEFAKYRRFGHTEHSYRFVHAGLQQYPFNMILQCEPMLKWFDPPSVTGTAVPRDPATRLAIVEMDIIREQLSHFPLQVIAPYHYMGPSVNGKGIRSRINLSRLYQQAFPAMIIYKKIALRLKG